MHMDHAKLKPAYRVVYDDHAHLLVGLSRTITIAKCVENVKTETSKWAMHHKDGLLSLPGNRDMARFPSAIR